MLGVRTCLAEMGKTATMACAINKTGILVRASGIGLMTATSAVLTVDNVAYTYTLLKENDFHWTEESLLSLGETALYAASTVMGIAELGNCIDMERMLEATGMACFPAGTKVLTEEGLKNIEDIKAGDKVYSTNEETGESGYQEVVQTFEKETDVIVHVFYQTDRSTAETDIAETDNEDIAGSERVVTAENADQETIASSEIETTMNHRFWSEGGWKTAGTLEQGDRLTLADGTGAVVTDITFEDRHTTVYNMEVADYHTYYVGEDSVWVHNMCQKQPGQTLNTGESGTVGKGGSDFGSYTFKEGIDVDLRGKGTVDDALEEAFRRVGEPKENFIVTKWAEAKNIYGKSVPVEWTSKVTGAQINIDAAHYNNIDAPQIPHVGYKTGGKRKSGGKIVGHIFVDEVTYFRPQSK